MNNQKAAVTWPEALGRLHGMLSRQEWHIGVLSQGLDAEAPDALRAVFNAGVNSSLGDPRTACTHGEVIFSQHNGKLRVQYQPHRVAFLLSAIASAIVIGAAVRALVPHLGSRVFAQWYGTWWAVLAALMAGAAVAYPLMRWRFTRMARKARKYSDAPWAKYSARGQLWTRVIGVSVFGWAWLKSLAALGRLPFFVQMLARFQTSPAPARVFVEEVLWVVIPFVVLTVLMLVDWAALIGALPGVWARQRAAVMAAGVLVLSGIGWSMAHPRQVLDAALTLQLESERSILTDSVGRIVALPGQSHVELSPRSVLSVRRLFRPALELHVSGQMLVEVGQASDTVHVYGNSIVARLAQGRYRILSPVGNRMMRITVERGRAEMWSESSNDPPVSIGAGQEAKLLAKAF